MARNESVIVNALAYGGLRAVGTLMQVFNVDTDMATAGRIGDLWYRLDSRRRARAIDHLRRSFPNLDHAAIDDLARRSMRHLLQLFIVEIMFTPRLITPSAWPTYIRLGNLRPALDVIADGGPAFLVTGHCGNFELLGYTFATMGFPITALARPLDWPAMNDWIVGIRQRRGMSILTKWGAMDQIPSLISRGRRIAFIADQNAGDRGMFVPFFGRLASAYKSIGLLAIRHEVPIVCGFARRLHPDRFHYELSSPEVIRPADWIDQPDPLYYITARYTRAIEMMVRTAPEQYFWVHRRWKSRPRHEREGKSLPQSLRRRIAGLPWMTPDDVEAVVEQSNRESRDRALSALGSPSESDHPAVAVSS